MNFLKTKPLIALFLVLISATISQAQEITLPKEVRFNIGDNLEWANPNFEDSHWGTQFLGKSWQVLDVYAWYRIKIIIPESLKKAATKRNGLLLNLGKIDDVDQTFFNGKLVGETGSFPPNVVTKWQENRSYTIPLDVVKWGKENVIAVRMYSNVGGAGMYEGPYVLSPIQWSNFISVEKSFVESENNGFSRKLIFKNNGDLPLDATIKYWIKNQKNELLFSETKSIHVNAEMNSTAEFISLNYVPTNEKMFNVGYEIIENETLASIKKEQLHLSNRNIEIPVLGEVKPVIKDKITSNFNSIPFQNQKFNGYLGIRFTQNLEQRLLNVDEFGLMGSYLNRPGIHPWAGEHVGKYLETASNVWKLTKNPALKMQMDRMMYELINTQKEDGYLGTYTPDQYWTGWDVWSHKYNLHGLLTYYATTGYKPALEASKKMGDLLCKTFGKKAGQKDIILAGEHVGMAATSVLDAMVDLYRYTGDKKYLDFCYYILDAWEQDNGPHVISAILKTGKVTDVGNRKAYEMLSNYVGLIKLYQLTGNAKYLKAVELVWQDVVKNRLYITGTTSDHEHFQEDGVLPAEANSNMGEGCVTVTWIQLNQNLFAITGDIKYLNQLEKSVYNQLLGAENPETGCVSYYTPLMDKKPYTCNITCCQSSVPRGIALIPNFTFGNLKNVPTLLFYEAANYKETFTAFNKEEIEATFKIVGNFPESGNVSITVETSKSANFPFALRVPIWCTNFAAKIGEETYKGLPNEMITINRNWKSGDKINVTFDMPIKSISGGKSYPNKIALQRGPQVLAFDSALNPQNISDLILNSKEHIEIGKLNFENKSELLPKNWIGKQAYSFDILNTNKKIIMVPFAEASQTEGDINVWLPLILKK